MSGFLIVCLFALFCIPFAPAVIVRKLRCKIKEAMVYDTVDGTSKTFDNGDVSLYEIDNDERIFGTSYEVEDNSGELSEEFDMGVYNTVVTDERITVECMRKTVFIYALDGNNAAFYLDIFPLEDFDHEFRVTRVTKGGKTLENVFAVNVKERRDGRVILAAVDSSGPRLIFPSRNVKWTKQHEDFDNSVSFIIELEPQGEEINVEFEYSGVANTFYAFLDSRGARSLVESEIHGARVGQKRRFRFSYIV